jgi:hypothetical protein
LYSPSSRVRIFESRKIGKAGHVARMGEKRNAYAVLVGKPQGKRTKEELDVGGRKILKWVLDRIVWYGMY